MRTLLLAPLAVLGLTGAACSEDAAVSIATEVAEDLGADETCIAAVESMVRASVEVSDDLVDGQPEDLASVVDALSAFVAAAPEEVRPDAQTLFDGWTALAEADEADDAIARAEAEAFLDGPEARAASDALGRWFGEHCTPTEDGSTTTTLR